MPKLPPPLSPAQCWFWGVAIAFVLMMGAGAWGGVFLFGGLPNAKYGGAAFAVLGLMISAIILRRVLMAGEWVRQKLGMQSMGVIFKQAERHNQVWLEQWTGRARASRQAAELEAATPPNQVHSSSARRL